MRERRKERGKERARERERERESYIQTEGHSGTQNQVDRQPDTRITVLELSL